MVVTRLPQRIEYTGDRQVDQLQRNQHGTVGTVNASPVAKGAFVGPVTFTAGQTQQLTHGIALPNGGTPKGWSPDDVTGGDGTFQRTAWDDKTISIRSA